MKLVHNKVYQMLYATSNVIYSRYTIAYIMRCQGAVRHVKIITANILYRQPDLNIDAFTYTFKAALILKLVLLIKIVKF